MSDFTIPGNVGVIVVVRDETDLITEESFCCNGTDWKVMNCGNISTWSNLKYLQNQMGLDGL